MTRRIQDVSAGEQLPELKKTIDLVRLVAYAGATWDFHRYHYDQDFAKLRNMAAPIADGQMFGAYFSQFVLDWAGPSGLLRRLDIRYKSLVHAGDEATCWGGVVEIDASARTVKIEGGVRARDGREIVAPAIAVVELPGD